MFTSIKNFLFSSRQTIYLIIMILIYAIAIIWTTLQSYARLEYSRTQTQQIQEPPESK